MATLFDMPKSKHRRNNKTRPRPSQMAPPPVRAPDPSPDWVPRVGLGGVIAGVLVILLGYLPVVGRFTNDLPLFGPNWSLVLGFILLAGGFGVLTRWR